MVELLASHYLVTTYTPCTPAVRLDARLLATTCTTHYICDVMLDGGLYVSG